MNISKIHLISLAEDFARNMPSINPDFSLESLDRLEEYLMVNVPKPHRPLPDSFFFDDSEYKIMCMGAYLGEVIRRNTNNIRWAIESNPEEQGFHGYLMSSADTGIFVFNKAHNRIYKGAEDNVSVFAKEAIKSSRDNLAILNLNFFDPEDQRIIDYTGSPVVSFSQHINFQNGELPGIIYHSKGKWVFDVINNNASSQPDEEDYEWMFLKEVSDKYPQLSQYFDIKSDLLLQLNDKNEYEPISSNEGFDPQRVYKASNAGGLKLDSGQWFKTNTESVLTRLIMLLFFGFATFYKFHWIFLVLFILMILVNIVYWKKASLKFKIGDINPGKVLSVNPDIVAVKTDLGMNGPGFPVIKIIKTNLAPDEKQAGKIIPTIALYNPGASKQPFWDTFEPVPVSNGVADKKIIADISDSFSRNDVMLLESYLAEIDTKEPGMYKIAVNESLWGKYKE